MHGPSHGGGSSFGGGSSSGGGNFGSFNSFNGPESYTNMGPQRRPNPPMFHLFGRTIILTSWKVVLFAFLCIVLFSSVFFCYAGAKDLQETDQQIAYYVSDEVGYKELIEKAEQGYEGYFKKTFNNVSFKYRTHYRLNSWSYTNCYIYERGDDVLVANYYLRYDGIVYYQIVYNFKDEDRTVSGLTYACYKEDQITSMSSFSVSYEYNGATVDSINSDYSLERCMDYHQALKDKQTNTNAVIVSSIIIAAMVGGIVLFVVLLIKKAKKDEELNDKKIQAEIDKTNAETQMVQQEIEKKNRICEYCGNPIPEDEDVCPSCGSRRHKKTMDEN